MSFDRKKEYEMLLEVLEKEGEDISAITENLGASMVINKDEVLHANSSKGVIIEHKKITDGVEATVIVKENHIEPKPIHLCFGMLPKEGKQVIKSKIIVEKDGKAKILSHCIFPNAINIEHIMEGEIIIEEGGELEYTEEHYHPDNGGIVVVPKTKVLVKKGGRYKSSYHQRVGRAGKLFIDYDVELQEESKGELLTKVFGKVDDEIETKERITLTGRRANGLIKSRIVLKGNAKSKFIGITEGIAPETKAHVDCNEVIMENATASAIPEIISHHPSAKMTHEAAIGQIDAKQLQTLMAKGLSEEEAIDIIVKGLLA